MGQVMRMVWVLAVVEMGVGLKAPEVRAALSAAAVAVALPSLTEPAMADGRVLFESNCASCHANGGNVVARGKTLSERDLEKQGYDSLSPVETIIARGKNAMPGFAVDCAPKPACTFGPRLDDQDIRLLARFVLQQALQGWDQ